jgi:hypothetical protein
MDHQVPWELDKYVPENAALEEGRGFEVTAVKFLVHKAE